MKLVLLQPQLRAFDTPHALQTIRSLVEPLHGRLSRHDLMLLPEHFYFGDDHDEYQTFLATLSQDFQCHVIGGSYHARRGHEHINTGMIIAPDRTVVCTYDKLRPYANERKHVVPGMQLGECSIDGVRILVLVCADFWFSDLFFRAKELPDLILVPALSVTRKSTPGYSRELWRHLALTRAYEFGVYVGISDWGHPSELPKFFTCGAGGFADPTTTEPERFFKPIEDSGLLVVDVDLDALNAFREDRRERGFFWKDGEK